MANVFPGNVRHRTTYQKGRVRTNHMDSFGTSCAVRPYLGFLYIPFYIQFELPYNIIDIDPVHYSFITCSAPDGAWMYVMTRQQKVDDAFIAPTHTKLAAMGSWVWGTYSGIVHSACSVLPRFLALDHRLWLCAGLNLCYSTIFFPDGCCTNFVQL